VSKHRGTLIFDLDGVVYLGGHGVTGAGSALTELAATGWCVLFATNNSSATAQTVVDKIGRLTEFRADPSVVVTSGMAAAKLLGDRFGAVHVVGEQGLRETLTASGIRVVADAAAADAVVAGIDFSLTYAKLDAASRAIAAGASFIATNTDATYPTPTGSAPGAGAIVSALETASGTTPTVVGKPHQPMIDLLADRLVVGPVWVIGDRPETDIAMAHIAGWKSILPLTGVVRARTELDGRPQPDVVVSSIADVPALVDTLTP
jgi:4-nitrophenyl phosphatase